jgi:hypothetical protein
LKEIEHKESKRLVLLDQVAEEGHDKERAFKPKAERSQAVSSISDKWLSKENHLGKRFQVEKEPLHVKGYSQLNGMRATASR